MKTTIGSVVQTNVISSEQRRLIGKNSGKSFMNCLEKFALGRYRGYIDCVKRMEDGEDVWEKSRDKEVVIGRERE